MQVHNYDANIDVNNVRVQREFSLLATFKKVFRMIARLQGLHDDHFALLFEDDIAAHTVFGGQVRAQRKAQREEHYRRPAQISLCVKAHGSQTQ